jgi:hypothetical protein
MTLKTIKYPALNVSAATADLVRAFKLSILRPRLFPAEFGVRVKTPKCRFALATIFLWL